MKQIALAAHNYESTRGGFPYCAITTNYNQPPYIPFVYNTPGTRGNPNGTTGRCSALVPQRPEATDIAPGPHFEHRRRPTLHKIGDGGGVANVTGIQKHEGMTAVDSRHQPPTDAPAVVAPSGQLVARHGE